MIKVKNGNLALTSKESLDAIMELKMPAKVSFSLARISSKITTLLEDIDKVRNKIVTDFSEKDEKGEVVFKKDEDGNDTTSVTVTDIEGYNKSINELMEIEVEIDEDKINEKDIENEKIESKHLMQLLWMFDK